MQFPNSTLGGKHRAIQKTGVGLRAPHFQHIMEHKPDIPWFEILIDNYLGGGPALYQLEQICNNYPISFHGVGMSLGSTDKLNTNYLKKLKQRISDFEPVHISDHLCWASFAGHYAHDLLPLPYVTQAISTVVDHVKQVQDYLGQQILIENVSSYLSYKQSVMEEWEFLVSVAEQADCNILLDINNIHVSAYNHNIDAQAYLDAVPVERVKEFHLAGYEDMQSHLLDTHGEAVHAPVWDLYQKALLRFGAIPTLIEWDNNIPEFSVLSAEADKADYIQRELKLHVA
ncbi:Uncharacterized protein conserved in bacteria, NMA0228-like [hydrothermal vent metagenome]|uniref:Uncharacterized protein conserved in bacteria, NMA0228-like n=1 Tax=hydrothermal vent metagenome TaxID=652676 RepID=A0A3B0ZCL0_9ZZZZ